MAKTRTCIERNASKIAFYTSFTSVLAKRLSPLTNTTTMTTAAITNSSNSSNRAMPGDGPATPMQSYLNATSAPPGRVTKKSAYCLTADLIPQAPRPASSHSHPDSADPSDPYDSSSGDEGPTLGFGAAGSSLPAASRPKRRSSHQTVDAVQHAPPTPPTAFAPSITNIDALLSAGGASTSGSRTDVGALMPESPQTQTQSQASWRSTIVPCHPCRWRSTHRATLV